MKFDYTIFEGKGRDVDVQDFFQELIKGGVMIAKMEIMLSPRGLNACFGGNRNTWRLLCELLGEEKLEAWKRRAGEYFKTKEFALILQELAEIMVGLPDELDMGEG